MAACNNNFVNFSKLASWKRSSSWSSTKCLKTFENPHIPRVVVFLLVVVLLQFVYKTHNIKYFQHPKQREVCSDFLTTLTFQPCIKSRKKRNFWSIYECMPDIFLMGFDGAARYILNEILWRWVPCSSLSWVSWQKHTPCLDTFDHNK